MIPQWVFEINYGSGFGYGCGYGYGSGYGGKEDII